MAETHFNDSAKLTDVYYNGTQLDKVYFNDTLVFERGGTITETINYEYNKVNDSLGGYYLHYFLSKEYKLQHVPKTVLDIRGGPTNTQWFAGTTTSGTASMPGRITSSGATQTFKEVKWSVAGDTITFASPTGTASTGGFFTSITITYIW